MNIFARWHTWIAGAVIALIAGTVLSGCDLSSLTGTQCTPQTCDYFVDSLVAAKASSGVTLLADSQNAVYSYDGSKWNKVGAESVTLRSLMLASPNFASDKTLFLGNSISTDGGQTWTALCGTVDAISPGFASDQTVFASDATVASSGSTSGPTGCPTSSGPYYVSKDGGKTWSPGKGPANSGRPDQFVLSPAFDQDHTILATYSVTQNQQPVPSLFKSTDGGQTWSQVLTGKQDIVAFSPNYAKDKTIFAISGTSAQKSTDGGSSWSTVTTPVAASFVAQLTFTPTYAQDHTIVLVSAAVDTGSSATHGTFISTDGGSNWTLNGPVTQRGTNQPAIVFSPNYASDKTAYCSSLDMGQGPAMSTDLGKNWTAIANGLTLSQGLGG